MPPLKLHILLWSPDPSSNVSQTCNIDSGVCSCILELSIALLISRIGQCGHVNPRGTTLSCPACRVPRRPQNAAPSSDMTIRHQDAWRIFPRGPWLSNALLNTLARLQEVKLWRDGTLDGDARALLRPYCALHTKRCPIWLLVSDLEWREPYDSNDVSTAAAWPREHPVFSLPHRRISKNDRVPKNEKNLPPSNSS